MPKLYNFTRLIKKYSTVFTLFSNGPGQYVSGKYVEGELEEKTMNGAVIPMSESKIYSSGGAYTSKDKQLYILQPFDKALIGKKVRYRDDLYSIESETDYTEYCDTAVYNLKWVSKFDTKN